MFSPAPMLRLRALVLARDARKVLTELGRRGVVELIRTGAANHGTPVPSVDAARCDQFLSRIAGLRRSLPSTVPPAAAAPRTEPEDEGWILSQADAELRAVEQQLAALSERRQALLRRGLELSAACEQLTGLEGLDFPLDLQGRTEFLHFVIGSLPGARLDGVRSEIGPRTLILAQPRGGERQQVIALASRGDRERLDAALNRAEFRSQPLPLLAGGTTATLSADKLREQQVTAAGLGKLDAALDELASATASTLDRIERASVVQRRLFEAEQTLSRTEATALLTGWIPAARADRVEQCVREITRGRCAITLVPPRGLADEDVPVLLEQPRWLRPFAMLVTAFGFPRYGELEPTLFLAVSYLLMFGLMFGDAGQGALLALGGAIVHRAGRSERARDGGLLLLYAGASSVVFGAVYGSYFGLPSLQHLALWHDPLEGDPVHLMYAAIAFGIVMISLGLVLNIVNCFRRGDVIGGLFDKFGVAGAVFYWGSLAMLANSVAVHGGATLLLLPGLPVLCWVVKGPLEAAFKRRAPEPGVPRTCMGMTVIESCVGAFEGVLVYLANTISFVRLAAYAMSHAALMTAFYMMAETIHRATVAGSLAIIVLGNLIALVLEGVIAAVQALRLEYYEFFGKFFPGGGRPFRPFALWSPTA